MSKNNFFDWMDKNIQYSEGRPGMTQDEMMHRAVLSDPAHRIWALQHYDQQLERDNLSIRERADILSEKAKLNVAHQQMLRLGR